MTEGLFNVERQSLAGITRFFAKIEVDRATGCWNWTASRVNGYGQFSYLNRPVMAHRFAYAWLVAPLPRGRHRGVPQIDHLVCSNRGCCNPAHLKLVTAHANNMRSDSRAAVNARKTHCPVGHELPLVDLTGRGRRCGVCRNEWHRRHYARNRERIIARVVAYERRLRAAG